MMHFQKTIKRSVSFSGVGLHSGEEARVTLHPAPPNSGISFVRTDIRGCAGIPAHFENVVDTHLATTLGRGQITISTVEHVLGALHGLGVDNVWVEVNGPEVPILDGSAKLFYDGIRKIGLESQVAPQAFISVRRRIEIKVAEKWAIVRPSSKFEIHGSVEWDHPAVGYQEFHYIQGETPFSELAGARTFGFLKDVDQLRKKGLARGASFENALVFNHEKVLNEEGLRFPDEIIRHKVLDALGDFKLAGMPIRGSFRLHRTGHDLHQRLLDEIFANPSYFEVVKPMVPQPPHAVPEVPSLVPGLVATA